ncbi:hypothetical protein HDV57DRAFT_222974 [Trichoderma longibrachiatum]
MHLRVGKKTRRAGCCGNTQGKGKEACRSREKRDIKPQGWQALLWVHFYTTVQVNAKSNKQHRRGVRLHKAQRDGRQVLAGDIFWNQDIFQPTSRGTQEMLKPPLPYLPTGEERERIPASASRWIHDLRHGELPGRYLAAPPSTSRLAVSPHRDRDLPFRIRWIQKLQIEVEALARPRFFSALQDGPGNILARGPQGRTDISSKLCLVHPQSVCFIFFSLDESISAYVTASIPGSCLFIISLPYLALYEYIYLSSISFLRKQSQRLFGFTFRFRPFVAVLPCQEQHIHHAGATSFLLARTSPPAA